MEIQRQRATPPLDRYVDGLWYYRDMETTHEREHVLPDGTFELMINLEQPDFLAAELAVHNL